MVRGDGEGRGRSKEDGVKKLFVGGLSRDTTDDTFRDYFSKFGEITDSIVIKDDQERSKGFGFVTFQEDHETESVIQAKEDGHSIDGKSVEVKRAIPRDAEPDQREKNSKMFVGGLSRDSNEDSIKQYFEEEFNCEVDSVDLIYEKKDQVQPGQEPKPRGFGFVTINNFDIVDKICVIKKHNIDGKEVEVKKAAPKSSVGGGGGGRGGGGGGGGRNYSQGGGGGYNQGGGGGYRQGGRDYNQGGDRYSQGGGGGGYSQGGGYNQSSGRSYSQGGDSYNRGSYQSQGGGGYGQQSYGGSYQNSSYGGPDRSRQSGRDNYRPY